MASPRTLIALMAVGFLSTVLACLRMVGDKTTVIRPPCGTCNPTALKLVPGDDLKTVQPTITERTVGADGCQRITVVCNATYVDLPNVAVQVMFQNGLTGPGGDAPFVDADLVCNNGHWKFVHKGTTTNVTEVGCQFTADTPVCQTCEIHFPYYSVFHPDDLIFTGPEVVNGCYEMVWTCISQGETTELRMGEWYTNDGVDFENSTETIRCNDKGLYEQTNPENGRVIIVEEMECLAWRDYPPTNFTIDF